MIVIVGLCVFSLFVLSSLAQEDPNCPDAPIPQLVINGQGRVTPGNANNIRDIPARSGAKIGEIPAGEIFNVLEGPTCADGLNWWLVSYEDLTGWTVEGQGTDYWVEAYDPDLPTNTPLPPTAVPSATPTPAPASVFEPPRPVVNVLQSGVQARVISDDWGDREFRLRVRRLPGVDGAIVTNVNVDDLVTILDGVQEVDGFIWREIETTDGQIGWVIEGLWNEQRSRHERTLLPICPYTTERLVFPFAGYIYTVNFDGSDACAMDRVPFLHNLSPYPIRWLPDHSAFIFAHSPQIGETNKELFSLSADGSQLQQLTRSSDVVNADWSPDGGRLLIAQSIDGRNTPQIWTMRADGTAYGSITSGNNLKNWAAWLADSETLVYFEYIGRQGTQMGPLPHENVIYRVNVSSGGLTELYRSELEIATVLLSPDHSQILIQGWELIPIEGTDFRDLGSFNSLLINVETGEITNLANNMPYGLFWLPDSSGFASMIEGNLSLVPSLTADYINVPLTRPVVTMWAFSLVGWLPDGQLVAVSVGESFSSTADDELIAINVETGLVTPLIPTLDDE